MDRTTFPIAFTGGFLLKLRSGFTLVEVLVSVLILAGSVTYVVSLYNHTQNGISYISQRSRAAFEDSLFLSKEIGRYDKSRKNAADLVGTKLHIHKHRSKKILDSIQREIILTESETFRKDGEDTDTLDVSAETIFLKGAYVSHYSRFTVHGL